MQFRDKDSNIVCLVAKQEDFNTIDEVNKYLVGYNMKSITIKEDYIRYYNVLPKKADIAYITNENEGYAFCKKGRGAQKVFVIERGKSNG